MYRYDPYNVTAFTVSVDPEDFQTPYEVQPHSIEFEMYEWKYYRLSNGPQHFQHVRLNHPVFGVYRQK